MSLSASSVQVQVLQLHAMTKKDAFEELLGSTIDDVRSLFDMLDAHEIMHGVFCLTLDEFVRLPVRMRLHASVTQSRSHAPTCQDH